MTSIDLAVRPSTTERDPEPIGSWRRASDQVVVHLAVDHRSLVPFATRRLRTRTVPGADTGHDEVDDLRRLVELAHPYLTATASPG